jgi:hypothetical protein
MDDTFRMRNKYALDDEMNLFCYSGCVQMFATIEQLEKHLLAHHSEETLKLWGISLPLLVRKYYGEPN